MQKTLGNPRRKRAVTNIVTEGFYMKTFWRSKEPVTHYSKQIPEEWMQILRLCLRAISGIVFQSYRLPKRQTERQQHPPEHTSNPRDPARRNVDDDSLLSESTFPSCKTGNGHTFKPWGHGLQTIHHRCIITSSRLVKNFAFKHTFKLTYPLVISTPIQAGNIMMYKRRRLGLLYHGTLSCCASRKTIISWLSNWA